MATSTKKPVRKKATPAKAAAKSTAVRKKAPAKKVAASTKKTKSESVRSFRVSKSDTPFLTFRITKQTIYWLILVAFVIVMQIWVLSVLNQVNSAINKLTIQNSQSPVVVTKKK